MADVKISDLPLATTPLSGTEYVPVVQSGVTSKVSVNATAPVRSVNTKSGAVTLNTDDITEGSTNKYLTTTRVRDSLSATQNVTYDAATGVITGPNLSSYLTNSAIGTTVQAHSNILDATTSPFTEGLATKLNGIEAGANVNVKSDWTAVMGDAQILNKPSLATVATSGQYSDLTGKPVVGTDVAPATSGTSILYGNGSGGFNNVTIGSGLVFSTGTLSAASASGTVTSVAMTVPTGLSISGSPITTSGTLAVTLTSGYSIPTTSSQTNWNTAYGWGNHASAGYLTSISGSQVTTALGYTPYNATNPAGYTTNTGTVTSVNLTASTGISVSGGPVTTSGSITVTNTAPMTYPSGSGIAVVSAGTSWGTTLAAPTGTIVGTSDTQTLTNKRITSRVSTTTSSATPTINTDNVDMYGLTAQAVDITSFTTNLTGTPTDGQRLWIYIVGTAARAITWGASFESSTATLPTTTVTTNRLDVGFVWNAATSKWRCVASA